MKVLPLNSPAPPLTHPVISRMGKSDILMPLPMKTILVVEDFVTVQQFLREMLESKGYRTFGATNGVKAYEVLSNLSYPVNLVLTDYHMPESNGYDLLKNLKANSKTQDIPVIFLTAETNPDIKKSVEALGFVSWIKKPYRSEVLFSEIEKVINQPSAPWGLFPER
jgi:CheY-like chemotaxis protein